MFGPVVNIALKLYVAISKLFRKPIEHNYIFQTDGFVFAIPKTKHKSQLNSIVFLSSEGNIRQDITQPPGTRYCYTAEELGGTNFIIKTIADGKETSMPSDEKIIVNCCIVRRSI